MKEDVELIYARRLIKGNYVTPKQLEECFNIKKDFMQYGRDIPHISQILIQMGYLTEEQYRESLLPTIIYRCQYCAKTKEMNGILPDDPLCESCGQPMLFVPIYCPKCKEIYTKKGEVTTYLCPSCQGEVQPYRLEQNTEATSKTVSMEKEEEADIVHIPMPPLPEPHIPKSPPSPLPPSSESQIPKTPSSPPKSAMGKAHDTPLRNIRPIVPESMPEPVVEKPEQPQSVISETIFGRYETEHTPENETNEATSESITESGAENPQDTQHVVLPTITEKVPATPWKDKPKPPAAQVPQKTLGFSKYEIIEEIGRGGMGAVYKARHKGTGSILALKVLLLSENIEDMMIGRFQREARAAASLDHPNIVRVYDVGVENNIHYLTMDFIEGESLENLVKEKKLTLEKRLEIIRDVAKGMDYAHERGIIHRDIKATNILINSENVPKVVDFGLAKHIVEDTKITRTGVMVGTPGHMAPEQVKGDFGQVDRQSDVFSLGVVLYYTLTGKMPFQGSTIVDLFYAVVNYDPIPPRKINPEISQSLDTVCMKALEKEKQNRYKSAKEMSDDIDKVLKGEATLAKPVTAPQKILRKIKRNKRLSAIIAAPIIIMLIVAVIAIYKIHILQSKLRPIELKPDEIYHEASIAYSEGNFPRVITLLENLLEKDQRYEKAYPLLGHAYATDGRRESDEQAIKYLEKSMQTGVNLDETVLLLIKIYCRNKNYPSALKLIEEQKNRKNTVTMARALLFEEARVYLFMNDHENCIKKCNTLLENEPTCTQYMVLRAKAYTELAHLMEENKNISKAQENYVKAHGDYSNLILISSQKDQNIYYPLRAEISASLKKYEDTLKDYAVAYTLEPKKELIEKWKSYARQWKEHEIKIYSDWLMRQKRLEYYYSRGTFYLLSNDIKNAREDLNQCQNIAPESATVKLFDALFALSEARYSNVEKICLSLKDGDAAYQASLIYCESLIVQGKDEMAQEVIDKGLEKNEEDYRWYLFQGMLWYQRKAYKLAEASLNTAIAFIDKKHVSVPPFFNTNASPFWAFFYRGRSLFELGSVSLAEQDFMACRRINPTHAEPYYYQALCHSRKDNISEGITVYDLSTSCLNDAVRLFFKGKLYDYIHKNDEAIALYRETLQKDHSYLPAWQRILALLRYGKDQELENYLSQLKEYSKKDTNLAFLYLKTLSELDGKKEEFRRALSTFSGPDFDYFNGLLSLADGDKEKAREYLDRVDSRHLFFDHSQLLLQGFLPKKQEKEAETYETAVTQEIENRVLNIRRYFTSGCFRKLYAECTRLYRDGCLFPDLIPIYGYACYELGLYDEAINIFQEGLKEEEAMYLCRFYIGLCYLKLGNEQEALKILKESIDKDRDFTPALKLVLEISLQSNRIDEKEIKEYLKRFPLEEKFLQDGRYYDTLYKSKIAKTDEETEENWNEYIHKCPKDYRGYRERAEFYTKVERFKDAESDILKMNEVLPSSMKYLSQLLLARLYIDIHNPQKAIGILGNIKSRESEASLLLYRLYLEKGEDNKAQGIWKELAKDQQFLTKAQIVEGRELINKGKFKEALELYHYIHSPETLFYSGYLFMKLNDMEKARQSLNLFIQEFPDSSDAYTLYGHICAIMGEDEKAYNNYKKAIALNPKDWTAYLLSADLCRKGYSYTDSIVNLRKAYNIDPHNPEIMFNLASMYLRTGDLKEASSYFEKCKEKLKDDPIFQNNMAVLEFFEGNVTEASNIFKTLLNTNASNLDILVNKGIFSLNTGDVQGAESIFQTLQSEMPDSPLPLTLLAEVALAQNDFDKSMDYLTKAFQKKEKSYEAYIVEAMYHIKQNNIPQAIKMYESAREYGNHPGILRNLGTLYHQIKQTKDAMECFEKLHKTDPNEARYSLFLALLYADQGKKAQAKEHLKKAIEDDPSFKYLLHSKFWN